MMCHWLYQSSQFFYSIVFANLPIVIITKLWWFIRLALSLTNFVNWHSLGKKIRYPDIVDIQVIFPTQAKTPSLFFRVAFTLYLFWIFHCLIPCCFLIQNALTPFNLFGPTTRVLLLLFWQMQTDFLIQAVTLNIFDKFNLSKRGFKWQSTILKVGICICFSSLRPTLISLWLGWIIFSVKCCFWLSETGPLNQSYENVLISL